MWFCLGVVLLAVVLLLARAAIATYASKQSIYYLNETQDKFNSTKCQEDRKQRDIPFHNVLGFLALGPCGAIQKVVPLRVGKGVVPLAGVIKAHWSFR